MLIVFRVLPVCIGCVLLLLQPLHSSDALSFTKSFVDQVNHLRDSLLQNNKQQNQKKVHQKIEKITRGLLYINRISMLSLGKYYKKITASKRKRFKNAFYSILTNKIKTAHLSNLSLKPGRKKIPITIKTEKQLKDTTFQQKAVMVKTEYKVQDIIYYIDFYFIRKDKSFLLYDVYVDEASLLLDFKNQFAKVIREKGFSYLLSKLERQAKKTTIIGVSSAKTTKVPKTVIKPVNKRKPKA